MQVAFFLLISAISWTLAVVGHGICEKPIAHVVEFATEQLMAFFKVADTLIEANAGAAQWNQVQRACR